MPKKSTETAEGGIVIEGTKPLDGAVRPVQIDGLEDGPRFERELNKERARVDRGGTPFSLLAIDADLDRSSDAFAQLAWTLAAVLSQRTRLVDTKGWFRGRIGVILPDTTSGEIPKICAQIEAAYRRSTGIRALSGTAGPPALRFEVFVYPNDGLHSALHQAESK